MWSDKENNVGVCFKFCHLCSYSILLKHMTTLFSFSNHDILSREWRVIVDQVQTNYHGRPIVLKLVRCDRAVDYEGYSLWSGVFYVDLQLTI